MPVKKVKKTVAKAKAEKAPSDPRAQTSAMIGYLKYQIIASKNTDEEKASAHKAMTIYNELPINKKGSFVKMFNETKDKKNLTWTKDFDETLEKSKNAVREKKIGLYTRHVASPICGYPHFWHSSACGYPHWRVMCFVCACSALCVVDGFSVRARRTA